MTHHNREWRKIVDQRLGLKLNDQYYEQVWKTAFGQSIALKVSLSELWSNIKREFFKGFKSKIKNKKA